MILYKKLTNCVILTENHCGFHSFVDSTIRQDPGTIALPRKSNHKNITIRRFPMALTVKDILQLQSLCSFRLHAGQKGLSRYVVSAGIGDYEFCADIDFPRQTAFEADSLVLSSLLFAKGRPELLLPAVQQLYEAGVSGLAYKTVIFHELPDDVLAFCNAHAFPLFSFGSDAYFENIIYEIMNAVRADDTNLLTEGNIRRMLADDFAKSQVTLLAKSLSLAFKAHVMGVYIKVDDAAERDTTRHAVLKTFTSIVISTTKPCSACMKALSLPC